MSLRQWLLLLTMLTSAGFLACEMHVRRGNKAEELRSAMDLKEASAMAARTFDDAVSAQRRRGEYGHKKN